MAVVTGAGVEVSEDTRVLMRRGDQHKITSTGADHSRR
jgi:hypothetical protein